MTQEIFAKRRKELFEKLNGGMAVLFAAPVATRNNDVHYEFRSSSDFYYLTGFREEEAAAIFLPNDEKPYRLFVMPKNPEREMWEGRRTGVEKAKSLYQADETYAIEQFSEIFSTLLKKNGRLYYTLGDFPGQDEMILNLLKNYSPNPRAGDKIFESLSSLAPLVSPMRKKKSIEEIELMRKNCQNSGLAHQKAMEITQPGMYEYQIEAEIEKWFRFGGADDLAYASIVAGGENATILHYKTNRDQLKDGDLLLIDAGGEMDLYASDITRTFPVNGRFTEAQKKIYSIVLDAQKAAILAVKPGVRFLDVHNAATEVLVKGLMGLGLLKGDLKEIMSDRSKYAKFYPHNTSHWLGMDVHDCGAYFDENKNSITLEEGNVLTIEPGIYIPSDQNDVPKEYWGIGIRIEDDILVTANGHENLTANCPKEIAEIEAIVGSRKT
ncbi:MAG: aminopeptidase P N-terminal domain-containing protein [Oligoflexia bacterium]|nr:aminopeptidase P N-terminal domain-containing protein [Oligoflexia bacterium]